MTALLSQLNFLQHATAWRQDYTSRRNAPQALAGARGVPCRATPELASKEVAVESDQELEVTPGFNARGRKTLAHPDYHIIQSMWHPTRNRGKQPADFTHKSSRSVWLRCPGCIHGCGRHHEWRASAAALTGRGGYIVCPSCDCRSGGFCACRSVAEDPRLSLEWDSRNPPPSEVAKSSCKKFMWLCPEGHPPYTTSCNSRTHSNTGCPVCGDQKKGRTRHPTLSDGRPDLVAEWDTIGNTKSPSEVRLGSKYVAQWVCSSCGGKWRTEVGNRALKGKNCPEYACRSKNRFRPRKFGANVKREGVEDK